MSRLVLSLLAAAWLLAWPVAHAQAADPSPEEGPEVVQGVALELDEEGEPEAAPEADAAPEEEQKERPLPRAEALEGVELAAKAPPVRPKQAGPFTLMMRALERGDWGQASFQAKQQSGAMERYAHWAKLRGGGGSFEEYVDFIRDHPGWPSMEYIHDRGEASIGRGEDPGKVVAYFGDKIPETGLGVQRLIEAHEARGEDGDAAALAVLAWRTRTLNSEVESALLERFSDVLEPHHEARLDDLLWRDSRTAALRQMGRVGEDWQKLAEARMALRTRAAGVDAKIEAVPEALQDNAGLVWERYNWRLRKGLHEGAEELMAERSTSAEALGRAEMWSNYRRIYARSQLREGNVAAAYALASRHFLAYGSDYADLEWLSGWIALRFLKDPELALWHFERFGEAVETPISLGRAGYWLGRAYTDLGDAEKARDAYAFGAQYQTSYYGLLAAEAAGLPMDVTLTGREEFPPLDEISIGSSEVLAVGLKMIEEGEAKEAERFLTHLGGTLERNDVGSLGALMIERGEVHLALKIAKSAARNGITIPAAYYPLHEMAKTDWPVAPELALSIARRESEFDPVVVSPAGARGLMQLMPGTAKDMAGELKIRYDAGKLTQDPVYNAQLGTAYLAGLIEIFGDAPVLVSVGYNAGPGRAVNWVSDRGDPRYPGVDVVDWIEMIPFRETRNYVMRVTESIPVYRARLTGRVEALEFTKLLHGSAN
ncbi:lytic transglycosylase domain-containing protein [Vannielia litorea]|uniref:lytic transglycosylase domain-containing protein n=1 Tax=Vannielia litorea TaxID=1217970 RepID=UPI001C98126F|nr:lytic transglycosylase domain-containing protein [Vannielia litorea]MBY6155290.1 lytic transglycosylase domain-containing protein [Vannielia litorea]